MKYSDSYEISLSKALTEHLNMVTDLITTVSDYDSDNLIRHKAQMAFFDELMECLLDDFDPMYTFKFSCELLTNIEKKISDEKKLKDNDIKRLPDGSPATA